MFVYEKNTSFLILSHGFIWMSALELDIILSCIKFLEMLVYYSGVVVTIVFGIQTNTFSGVP